MDNKFGGMMVFKDFGALIRQQVVNELKSFEVNLSELSNGLYLIKLHLSNGITKTEKINIVHD
jgi:hypothetical protein